MKIQKTQIALILFLILVASVSRLAPGPTTIDDSYITFRYARNILDGNGFVYNPGERVMGTTTGLYTMLMVIAGGIGGGSEADFPRIAWIVNLIADCLTCVLLWKIGKELNHGSAGYLAGLVWAVAPFSVTFSIGGLETSVFVLLLTISYYAYIRKSLIGAAAGLSLALLTRPDGIIFVFLIGVDWLARSLKTKKIEFPWRAVLVFAIPLALWYGFSYLYFGTVIPHSVQAKLNAYRLPETDAFIRFIQHYATPFLEDNLIGVKAIAFGVFIYPFLFIIGFLRVQKLNNQAWIWAIYPWIYLVIYSVANPLIFRWYLTPPLPPYFFFIIAGLMRLIEGGINKTHASTNFKKSLVFMLATIIPMMGSLSDWQIIKSQQGVIIAPQMAYIELEKIYRRAAEFINNEARADSVLAAGDVGVLGYYTNIKILDTVGLNSNQALKYYPLDEQLYTINYAIAPQLILDEMPDYLVFLEVYGRKGLLVNDGFLAQYTLRKKIPTDIYGSDGMLIYELMDN